MNENSIIIYDDLDLVSFLSEISLKYSTQMDGGLITFKSDYPVPKLIVNTNLKILNYVVNSMITDVIDTAKEGEITIGFRKKTNWNEISIFVRSSAEAYERVFTPTMHKSSKIIYYRFIGEEA